MHRPLGLPTWVGLLVVCAFFAVTAAAQETADEDTPPASPSSTLFGPLSIGFRVGIVPGNLMAVDSTVTSDTTVSPIRTTEAVAESTSSHVGWGPVIQLYITRRIALTVDLIHRGVGYDATTTVVDEATDTDDAEFVSEQFETTSAKYWDLAILPRYHFGDPGRPRAYLTAGFALRSLSKLEGGIQTTDDEGNIETSDLVNSPANTAVRGVAFGGGIQVQDDVGFKLEIEFRHTRWFRRSFDTDFARSSRQQSEVLLGLTF